MVDTSFCLCCRGEEGNSRRRKLSVFVMKQQLMIKQKASPPHSPAKLAFPWECQTTKDEQIYCGEGKESLTKPSQEVEAQDLESWRG